MIDIKNIFLKDLKNIKNLNELNNLQNKYIGKNSELQKQIKNIKNLFDDEKIKKGKELHLLRQFIIDEISNKKQYLTDSFIINQLKLNEIDVTLPELDLDTGNNHPLTIVKNELTKIFNELGFNVVSGTEIDNVKYNFELLDIEKDHPARNNDDCFYITDKIMLRTHSTNVTAKILSSLKKDDYKNGNIGIVSTGNVYRRDTDDSTHTHQFSQIDGVLIGNNISFSNLKWILEIICKKLFGNSSKIRMRPSFFPFTRLSAEVDVSCFYCNLKGCRICKQTGWIEILGSGMLSRKVLNLCNVPKDKNALAFGIGVERIVMLKYLITDIRKLYTNDISFLKQFKNY